MLGITFFFNWEVQLIILLQSLFLSFKPVFGLFNQFGDQYILMLILGFIYWCYDKKLGKTLLLTLAMGAIFNSIIKNFFLRRRPYFDNSSIKCIYPAETSYPANNLMAQGFSFPSLHATNVVTVYASLALYLKKYWITILAVIIIVMVGISRLFSGVHYPTDVLAGYVLGFIAIALIFILQKYFKESWKFYLVLAIIGCVGLLLTQNADYFRAFGILIGLVLAFLFEEKYVNFKSTKSVKLMVIRLIGGIVVVLIVLSLKVILPQGTDLISYSFRAFRYALAMFLALGVYPLLFNKFENLFGR